MNDKLRELAQGLRYLPRDILDMSTWRCCVIAHVNELIADCELQVVQRGEADYIPVFAEEYGYGAVMKYFGITRAEAYYLFASDHYDVDEITPELVSNRILSFIHQKEQANET